MGCFDAHNVGVEEFGIPEMLHEHCEMLQKDLAMSFFLLRFVSDFIRKAINYQKQKHGMSLMCGLRSFQPQGFSTRGSQSTLDNPGSQRVVRHTQHLSPSSP